MGMTCEACEHRRQFGRGDQEPIHCSDCHQSWGGVEAQHCVNCHVTFTNVLAAEAHEQWLRDEGWICHPVVGAEGWRERRPGVWTNRPPMSQVDKARLSGLGSTVVRIVGAVG